MKLLALDTSTEACSCALAIDGAIDERYEIAPRRHGELVLPMIEDLLQQAGLELKDLDGLAFGRGPGAFTGVRVGAGVVQGLALASNLSVAPVSTLQALARSAFLDFGARQVLTAIDARMGEVYFAGFEIDAAGVPQCCMPEQVCPPQQIPLPDSGQWFGVGTGWDTYASVLTARLEQKLSGYEANRFPRARDIAFIGMRVFAAGEMVAGAQAVPVYLRDNVARKPAQL